MPKKKGKKKAAGTADDAASVSSQISNMTVQSSNPANIVMLPGCGIQQPIDAVPPASSSSAASPTPRPPQSVPQVQGSSQQPQAQAQAGQLHVANLNVQQPVATAQTMMSLAFPMFPNVVIPKQEFDLLIGQRDALWREKQEYESKLRANAEELQRYYVSNLQKDREIEELRRANQALTDHITELEAKIASLERTISELRASNASLQTRVDRLDVDNVRLTGENIQLSTSVQKLLLESEFSKHLVVIQDLNRQDLLESALPTLRRALQKLREQRVGDCHYIYDVDDSDVVEYKRYRARNFLMSMSADCKAKFDARFKGVVDAVIGQLPSSFLLTVPDSEITEVDEWMKF